MPVGMGYEWPWIDPWIPVPKNRFSLGWGGGSRWGVRRAEVIHAAVLSKIIINREAGTNELY